MLETYLWSPTDLKPWLCLFGVILAFPVAFLLIKWRLKKSLKDLSTIAAAISTDDADSRRFFRQTARGINPNPTDTISLLSILPRWMQIGFISLSMIVVCLIFITVPAVILADYHLTAKVAVVNADNTAFTRQLFIWDTTYGPLPGKGNYIVNRADFPTVILRQEEREVIDPVYIETSDYGRLTGTPRKRTVNIPAIDTEVPPHTLLKVDELPSGYIQDYIQGYIQGLLARSLSNFAGNLTPRSVYDLMLRDSTTALTPSPVIIR
ncbi:MAG: hypothetical protein K2I51_04800 [Muribaculaceae bacterium]|nr:hypothetical protein [Muribaculaceae bacterium]